MPFTPPFELHPYQVDLSSRMYFQDATILSASTGMGKGLCSLCTSSLLVEDNKIDHIVIACEKSKLYEWSDEVAAFTDLSHVVYAGSIERRAKLRKDLPQVIIGVYETIKNDLGNYQTHSGSRGREVKSLVPGELLAALENKRVMLLLDEAPAKLGASRTSQIYKIFLHARKALNTRVMVLSATPVDRDIEGYYNLLRLVDPEFLPVRDFYRDYTNGYDLFKKVSSYKNITAGACSSNVVPFKDLAAKYLLVKNKSDTDVVGLFPSMPTPDYSYVRLSPKVAEFYSEVVSYFTGGDNDRTLFTLMRQIVGHPCSILHSDSEMAQETVRLVGEKFIQSLATDKLDALVDRLKMFRRQGAQVVVFTFFGQSILPLIADRLRDERFSFVVNHGQLSSQDRELNQKKFKAGDAEIFLSSDSGARGVNLGMATYVENVEMPLKHSAFIQRINRIHRINSTHETVFAHSFVVKDSIEEAITDILLTRHAMSDTITNETKLTSAVMAQMLEYGRNSAK